MHVIEVQNLVRTFKVPKRDGNFLRYLFSREYDIKSAVSGISFKISKGELVGFIGPNGAGKSTTIKMLTGILVPTEGTIKVLGNEPHLKRKENSAKVGVVFGQRSQLWWDLPVKDSFELIRRIYKVPMSEFKNKMTVLSEVLGIDDFINTPVRLLSLGQRMRSDLAAALIHNPQILFLDEPTIGLDIVVKKQIREFIRKINRELDITVILTTHDMRDIEEICERTILIDHGKLILDSDIQSIRSRLGRINTLTVDFVTQPEKFELRSHVKMISKEDNRWTLSFDREKISANDLILMCSSFAPVSEIYLKEPDIEDIMRSIYSGEIVL